MCRVLPLTQSTESEWALTTTRGVPSPSSMSHRHTRPSDPPDIATRLSLPRCPPPVPSVSSDVLRTQCDKIDPSCPPWKILTTFGRTPFSVHSRNVRSRDPDKSQSLPVIIASGGQASSGGLRDRPVKVISDSNGPDIPDPSCGTRTGTLMRCRTSDKL